jgi:hypothetical protein
MTFSQIMALEKRQRPGAKVVRGAHTLAYLLGTQEGGLLLSCQLASRSYCMKRSNGLGYVVALKRVSIGDTFM